MKSKARRLSLGTGKKLMQEDLLVCFLELKQTPHATIELFLKHLRLG